MRSRTSIGVLASSSGPATWHALGHAQSHRATAGLFPRTADGQAEPGKLGDDGFSNNFGRSISPSWRGRRVVDPDSRKHGFRADHREFERANIAASDVLSFSRAGQRPDGSAMTVGFSLVFARDPTPADAGFATLPPVSIRRISGTPRSRIIEHRQRYRRRGAGRRESDRSSHLPVGLRRRTRVACDVARCVGRNAARRYPDHGPGGVSQSVRR